MTEKEMKDRTKKFAIRVINLSKALAKDNVGNVIATQLIKCGTSVGANYRSACRGRSTNEFVAKLGIVEEEADESAFWLEVIIEAEIMKAQLVQPLLDEANEITAIIVQSIKSARNRGG